MTAYALLVFVHVVAAVTMFAAWSVEGVLIAQLRRTCSSRQARYVVRLRSRWSGAGRAAMLVSLGTGIWMMLLRWRVPGARPLPWMTGSFAALIVIMAIGLILERRAAPRLRELVTGNTQDASDVLHPTSRILAVSLMLRGALGIGILGLMTAKPGAVASLAILSGSVAAGLVSVAASGRRRATSGRMAVESRQ